MEVANERIKEEKATAELVAKVIIPTPMHKEEVEQKIYVGPNVPGLTKYTVVESIEVPHIKSMLKECPAIEKLFISINKMAETEARIAQKGTLEQRHFNQVLDFKSGKGDK